MTIIALEHMIYNFFMLSFFAGPAMNLQQPARIVEWKQKFNHQSPRG